MARPRRLQHNIVLLLPVANSLPTLHLDNT